MGSLSNLYISQSYISLIHLGSNSSVTTASVELQDGLGNGIGVFVNSQGNVNITGQLSASNIPADIATQAELNAYTASTNARLDNIETTTASLNISVSNINSFTSSQNTKNTTLATYTASVNTKFDAVGVSTASLNTFSASNGNTSLNAYTASQDTKNATLGIYTASVNTKFDAVSNSTSSLNAFTASQISFNASATASILQLLNLSSSLSGGFVTEGELAAATGSLINQINTKLNTSSFNAYTQSNDNKVNSLINATSSYAISSSVALVDYNQQQQINSLIAVTASFLTSSADISSLNAFTASQETKNSTLASVTASLNNSVSSLNSFTQSQVSINTNVANSASLYNTKWNTLENVTSSLIAATASYAISSSVSTLVSSSIQNISASLTVTDTYLQAQITALDVSGSAASFTALNAFTASQNTKNSTLATYTASVDSKFTAVGSSTSSLNTFTSSANQRLGSLETNSASVNISISNLNTTTASLNNSVSKLNDYTSSQNTINTNVSASQSIDTTKWNTLGGQSGSWITESETGSFAYIDRNNNWSVNQNFTNITAVSASFTYIQTTYETSSVIYSSGSNIFGDELSDVQTLSGSVKVQGSLTVNGTPVLTSSADVTGFVTTSSFNAYTSSNNQRVSSLETNSASVNISISNLNTTTASLNTSITNINSFTQSANQRIGSLEAATSSYVTSAITASSLVTASVNLNTITFTKGDSSTFNIIVNTGSAITTDLTSLNNFTSSQYVSNSYFVTTSSFNSYTASQDTKNSTLASVTSSLNSATASLFTSASLGLVTASISGQLLSFTKGNQSQFTLLIPTGSGTYVTGSYGAFQDSTTQSGSANTAYKFKFNTTDVSDGVILSGSTGLKVGAYGTYNLEWSGQLVEGSGGEVTSVWVRVNNIDVSGSRGDITVTSNSSLLPAWNYFLTLNPNDVVELMWSSTGNNTTWAYSPAAVTPTRPAVASIIATLNRVDVGGGTNSVSTASFNSYTSSTNSRLTNIESTTASLNTSISNLNTATSSLFTSASLALVTASFDTGTRNLTFTKGNTNQFSVNIPAASGSTINTGSFATTGSNAFIGKQTITGSLIVSSSTNHTINGGAFTVQTLADTVISASSVQITGSNGIFLNSDVGTIVRGNAGLFVQAPYPGLSLGINPQNSGSAYNITFGYVDTTTDPTNVFSVFGLTDATTGVGIGTSFNSYTTWYPNEPLPMLYGGGYYNSSDAAVILLLDGTMDLVKPTYVKSGMQVTGSFGVTGSVGIHSGSYNGEAVSNITPISSSQAAVQNIVTLTQSEYNSITPNNQTLYIII